MKKRFILAVVVCGLSASAVLAQSNLPPTSSRNPPAVSTMAVPSKTEAAPVAGKNSFTKGEATRRIAAYGYAGVSVRNVDSNGIWHATATKGGKQVDVVLDYQGNVVEQ